MQEGSTMSELSVDEHDSPSFSVSVVYDTLNDSVHFSS